MIKIKKKDNLDLSEVFQKFKNFLYGQTQTHLLDISTRFEFDDVNFYNPLCRIDLLSE